jgi:uncharacterized membrane protein
MLIDGYLNTLLGFSFRLIMQKRDYLLAHGSLVLALPKKDWSEILINGPGSFVVFTPRIGILFCVCGVALSIGLQVVAMVLLLVCVRVRLQGVLRN